MDAVTLKFVEHDRRFACDHCIFRLDDFVRDDSCCAFDHKNDSSDEIQCRAYHERNHPKGRKDGKDGYWTI